MHNRRKEILGDGYIRERARRAVEAEFEDIFAGVEDQPAVPQPEPPKPQPEPPQPEQNQPEQPDEAFGYNAAYGDEDDGQSGSGSSSGSGGESSGEDGQSASDEEADEAEDPLTVSLRQWAVQFKVPLVAVDSLLTLLQPHHPTLPKSAKTLLKTPRERPLFKQLLNGKYCHIGLKKGLLSRTSKGIKPNTESISLDIFVDAFKIYDTGSNKCTAILGRSLDLIDKRPFVVGLFYGAGDPNPIEDFLSDYITEMHVLLADGISVLNQNFPVRVRLYEADALGRAYLKGTASHSSRDGCERCTQVGPHHGHQCYSTEVSEPPRTDVSFRDLRDQQHHNYVSPLTQLPTGFISQFPFCAMHLLDLGICRRYLSFIVETGQGPLNARMTAAQMNLLSDLLNTCSNFIPVEFTRKPSLKRLKSWRASELKMFMLYLAPVLLCFVEKDEIFKLFMLLHTSVFIMHSDNLIRSHLQAAKENLQLFVQYSAQLLGPGFVVYNVHSALHLHEDVERHGKLSSFSGYPFEDMLGQLKRVVRSPNRPLEQVFRRLAEKEKTAERQERRRISLLREHRNGPVPMNVDFNAQFSQYNHDLYTLKISIPNNCVGLADGKYGLVVNILSSLDDILLVVKVFRRTADIYDFPMPSTTLGSCVVGDLDDHLQTYNISDLVFKCFMLPMDGDTYAAVPLVHMV
ncbi:uncharacterized protein LOC127750926 [Frankliniella occidentalis]|uniref:Uncharacterized protein LOC127750926 n=1 Tax=Frankliniella occidentalis TaxID=133901 RepID=A0A9C6XT30_FRAOC|nr:uncharacterized protein LOC127750926 [Frankliniella occidentalis]